MVGTKILVVDDDLGICDVLKVYFENEGCEVITANDGVEGVNAFKASDPDLVLLDIMLPKKTDSRCWPRSARNPPNPSL